MFCLGGLGYIRIPPNLRAIIGGSALHCDLTPLSLASFADICAYSNWL